MLHASCFMLHASCLMPHASCFMSHASCFTSFAQNKTTSQLYSYNTLIYHKVITLYLHILCFRINLRLSCGRYRISGGSPAPGFSVVGQNLTYPFFCYTYLTSYYITFSLILNYLFLPTLSCYISPFVLIPFRLPLISFSYFFLLFFI